MTITDARAAVAHFVPTRDEHYEPIAQHVAETGVNVLHAAWELYGRPIGVPCQCTPCMEPPTGEVVLRILVSRL